MKKLEEMGNTLVNTALHYTHPNFSDMYPDWGVVCNIGETLIEMSNQPTLNEDQQTVLEWLKSDDHPNYSNILDLFSDLLDYQVPIEVADAFTQMMTDKKQQFQVLSAFAEWGLSEVAE